MDELKTDVEKMKHMYETKWERVAALGQVALAAKDAPAGHRVYLRAMTMIEIELGIKNDKNAEVGEGYLASVKMLQGS